MIVPRSVHPARIAIGLMFVAVLALFFLSGLEHQLTLGALKLHQSQLNGIYRHRPLFVTGIFFSTTVVLAALCIPGSVVVTTLAAGAIFGLWLGTAIESFALAIGASVAFVASRYVLRDWLSAQSLLRWRMDRGARDTRIELMSLRLIPALPFSLVNIAMGLTTMRIGAFYLVTQLALLPTTMIYASTGRRLGAIKSATDVVSAPTLVALSLVAMLSLVGRMVSASSGRAAADGQSNRHERR